jgi:broad specificity phosphatase PhoE
VEVRYQGIFGGRIDMNLSPRGHEQAAALATYLHRHNFDAVYASPMRRVQQTLAPFQLNGAPKAAVVPELREFDFGDWTGLTFDEVHQRFGVRAEQWLEQIEAAAVPNGECVRRLGERLGPCLRQLLAKHAGQTVLVACHGGVIRMLLSLLLDWPLPRFNSVEVDYASITQVLCGTDGNSVRILNFAPWRDLAAQ